MKHVFIVNPVSGKKNPGVYELPHMLQVAKECGVHAQVAETQAPKHATALAQEFAKTGDEVRLYAVGGDGTLNEVFAGAYPFPNAEVACVPCGSGNDFIRSFGTADDFLDIEKQIKGRAITIDLMEVDGGVSAALTSTGLDAEVANNIPKYRRIPLMGGSMAYNISIVERLLHPLGKKLRITMDGKAHEGYFLIAAVCNGQTYGGGYRAAPEARLDDGMLDVVFVNKLGRLKIASIIGKYKNGLHIKNGEIVPELRGMMQYYRAKEVEIVPTGNEEFILNVDGETGPAPRLYAKVLPGVARFVLPQHITY